MPDIFKSLKNLYFLFQVLKDSIYICQKNDCNSLNCNKTQINHIIFEDYFHLTFIIWPPNKDISSQIQLFEKTLSKESVLTHENSISLIYLLLKWNFLNILSFPWFLIGSIAQSKYQEMLEIIKSLKTWIFFFKLSKTLPTYARTMMLRLWNSNKTQIN